MTSGTFKDFFLFFIVFYLYNQSKIMLDDVTFCKFRYFDCADLVDHGIVERLCSTVDSAMFNTEKVQSKCI